VTIVKKHQNIS